MAWTRIHTIGQFWMSIVWNCLHKEEFDEYIVQRIVGRDKFDWNATKLNGEMVKLVDNWPIIMKMANCALTFCPAVSDQDWSKWRLAWTEKGWKLIGKPIPVYRYYDGFKCVKFITEKSKPLEVRIPSLVKMKSGETSKYINTFHL